MRHFNEQWLFEPDSVDCLILSHAHIDHCGRIPKLVRDGFEGPIYATHATRSLCAIMLLDSAYIQERDAEYHNKRHRDKREPLYRSKDVKPAMERFVGYAYNKWFDLRPGLSVQFRDAGHILGSASITLRIEEAHRTVHIGFTGDIGRPMRPILRDPKPLPACDYLICESTYGDREHLEAPAEHDRLLKIIRETVIDRQGKLLIPAFSVGRTQEIVHMLDRMENTGELPKVPVYVDSPLAVNATTVFGAHPECYDSDLNEYLLMDDNPFGFNDLQYIRKVEASKALNISQEPSIIVSASGMMNAGRSKHHLAHMIADRKNTVLIVGYASPNTPAGKLRAGAETIRLFGEEYPVRAHIEIMDSFSAHADRTEMLNFLEGQQQHLKKVFLVHGTIERQQALRTAMLVKDFKEVLIPELGESVHL